MSGWENTLIEAGGGGIGYEVSEWVLGMGIIFEM